MAGAYVLAVRSILAAAFMVEAQLEMGPPVSFFRSVSCVLL